MNVDSTENLNCKSEDSVYYNCLKNVVSLEISILLKKVYQSEFLHIN